MMEGWSRGCHPCLGLLSHQLCHGIMGSVGVMLLCPHSSTKPCKGAPEPTGHGLLLLCSGHCQPEAILHLTP